jgi:hypothetical protein
MGVTLKLVRVVPSLPSETSPWWWTHATSRRDTLSAVIWFSGE